MTTPTTGSKQISPPKAQPGKVAREPEESQLQKPIPPQPSDEFELFQWCKTYFKIPEINWSLRFEQFTVGDEVVYKHNPTTRFRVLEVRSTDFWEDCFGTWSKDGRRVLFVNGEQKLNVCPAAFRPRHNQVIVLVPIGGGQRSHEILGNLLTHADPKLRPEARKTPSA